MRVIAAVLLALGVLFLLTGLIALFFADDPGGPLLRLVLGGGAAALGWCLLQRTARLPGVRR